MVEQLSGLSPQEQRRAGFTGKMHEWASATRFRSEGFLNDPHAQAVLDYGPEAIPWLLKYLREECRDEEGKLRNDPHSSPHVALAALSMLVPVDQEPQIPEEVRGRVVSMLDIIDAWGVDRGHLRPKDR